MVAMTFQPQLANSLVAVLPKPLEVPVMRTAFLMFLCQHHRQLFCRETLAYAVAPQCNARAKLTAESPAALRQATRLGSRSPTHSACTRRVTASRLGLKATRNRCPAIPNLPMHRHRLHGRLFGAVAAGTVVTTDSRHRGGFPCAVRHQHPSAEFRPHDVRSWSAAQPSPLPQG